MKTRQVLTLVAAGGLVLTPLGLMPSAEAAGTGALAVHVYDWSTGGQLAGVQVTLYNTATGSAVTTKSTPVDDPATPENEGSGNVTFTGLDAGSYTAKAHDPSNKHADRFSVVREVRDDSLTSTFLELVPTTIEVGRISGTVVQNEDLSARVEVYRADVTQAAIVSGDAHPVATTTVYGYDYDGDAQDSWSLKVPGGQSYKVRIGDRDTEDCTYDYDTYTQQCAFGSAIWVGPAGADADTATTIAVPKAKTITTSTVRLPGDGPSAAPDRVAGTVTGPGGVKLDEVEVELFKQYEHDGQTTWREVASESTGDDGAYGLATGREWTWRADSDPDDGYDDSHWERAYDESPLGPGKYTLRFSDEAGEYKTVFLGNVVPDSDYEVPATAGTLDLGATGTATANVTLATIPLATGSGAFGSVRDDAGAAHRAYVRFYDTLGNQLQATPTRRDGTWSAPATDLAPGQYKVRVDAEDVVSGWYGGKTFSAAKTVTVPVKGAANVGSPALQRYATLSGSIAMPTLPGTDSGSRWVTVRDARGNSVAGDETAENGAYSLRVEPGTYYLSAGGEQWSSWDESAAQVSYRPFIQQFWKGRYTLATATPITVGSGAKATGLSMTLGNRLLATAAPRITGTAKAGSTLTAGRGTWNMPDDLSFSFVWKRGSTKVGSAATYKPTKADAGKTLTVTVTAVDTTGTYVAGASTSPSVKVAKPAKPKKPKKRTGRRS